MPAGQHAAEKDRPDAVSPSSADPADAVRERWSTQGASPQAYSPVCPGAPCQLNARYAVA